ncbi:MAG TPA: hypothetical protein VMV71_00795 [Candidatus Paceibacterota bacterium]|nr:hypothetical protein [Candidatus Paceibacterota bacterium]
MTKKGTIKSHLLIGNKFLGALVYFKDAQGRGALKLSFKNKFMGFNRGSDVMTTLPVPLKATTPVSLDLSYKFLDSILELKKMDNGKIEPEFYDVPIPISQCLFFLRIRDWRSQLEDDSPSKNPLVLTPPSEGKDAAVVFSFLAPNGRPPVPRGYECLMATITLPENPLNTFCIGVLNDANPNPNPNDFAIYIPLPHII